MSKEAYSHPYWLDVAAKNGDRSKPKTAEIMIVGSGLTGVSVAYWLLDKGFTNICIVDDQCEKAASFRNCGHILYGTVESMLALSSLYGEKIARDLWALSIEICHEVRDTINRHSFDVEYRQDGYLVIAIDESEDREIKESIRLLNKYDFPSRYLEKQQIEALGFKNVYGGRYEAGSAQAHPTKFRNALLEYCLANGVRYHSGVEVRSIEEKSGLVTLECNPWGELQAEAVVIATNAYSPLVSDFFARHRLVEPFRGQIICSEVLQHDFAVKYPHSFDHGYEYALVTPDNRLMIGGWRHHTEGGELGIYDIGVNPKVELGLKEFVAEHYAIKEAISWSHSWSGIMAASQTGFPFIGPTDSQRIFTCAAYTGHGFSWAHGSAKLLAKIMCGEAVNPIVMEKFRPAPVLRS